MLVALDDQGEIVPTLGSTTKKLNPWSVFDVAEAAADVACWDNNWISSWSSYSCENRITIDRVSGFDSFSDTREHDGTQRNTALFTWMLAALGTDDGEVNMVLRI